MIDCLVAVAIVGLFFSALYGICSQSLGVLNTGRDLASAQQYSQYRLEQLRNCKWAQVTDSAYLRASVLDSAPPGSPLAGRVTETLTINSYPTALAPAIQISRPPAGPANPVSVNTAVADGDLAQVNLLLNWPARRGRASRTVSTTFIVSRY